MFVRRRLIVNAFLISLSLSLALPASAAGETRFGVQASEMQGRPLQLALLGAGPKQQGASSAAEAAKIAKRRYGGKVLKVETVKSGDEVRYRVKILQDDGRVKTVVIKG